MTALEEILALTSRIETLVADANWGEAAGLEAERRALLRDYVSGHPDRVADLKPVHERARDLLRRAGEQRAGLISESDGFLKRARAMRAYLDRVGDSRRQ